MNVWLIRLSMTATLDRGLAVRFSETALSRRPCPGHRPAGRHAQRCSVAGEAGAVARRRLAEDPAERTAEGAQAVESDLEADLGHGAVGLAQQLHCALHAAALQVAMRALAERRPELTAEVGRRDVCDARQARDVERLGERAVHRVAG